jgi:hypothetical protein
MSRKNNNTISNNTINFNTLKTSFTKPNYKVYPENEEENHCHYISSRGFLKACDIHSLTPISSIYDLIGYDFDFNKLEDNNKKESKSNKKPIIYTIYICNSAIAKFADKLKNDKAFKKLKCKFIVVSGDSDDTCPEDLFNMYSNNGNQNDIDFKNFIENDKIIHWYSQNCLKNSNVNNNTNTNMHNKLSQIPIGLGYHHFHNEDIEEEAKKIVSPMKQEEILDSIINTTQQNKKLKLPFWKRELKCYINFNFPRNYIKSRFGYDRYEAITQIPKHLTFSEKNEVPRTLTWNTQSKYAFVVSPFGNGWDCHRTWEALILGCIPIVKTSGLDSLYDDLPVLIVQDWTDITEKLLMNVITDFKKKHENNQFNYDKLTLNYWMDKINSHKFT